MQNQINTTPITQFIQQIRSSELSQSKTVSIDIQKARLLALSLAELLDKVTQDYETMYGALKRSVDTEVVNVTMDGGGFEDRK
jgi:uncharacterized membrane-anchored protein YhcB (DUF1043 family)